MKREICDSVKALAVTAVAVAAVSLFAAVCVYSILPDMQAIRLTRSIMYFMIMGAVGCFTAKTTASLLGPSAGTRLTAVLSWTVAAAVVLVMTVTADTICSGAVAVTPAQLTPLIKYIGGVCNV